MIVQLDIEDNQSEFLLNLFNQLKDSVNSVKIIDSTDRVTNSNERELFMKYQSENGFSKNILSDEREDVWNDL